MGAHYHHESYTFMDALTDHVKDSLLNEYLKLEQYDTDSVKMDVMESNGNLCTKTFNQMSITKLQQFMAMALRM